jgi:hypothetical protein
MSFSEVDASLRDDAGRLIEAGLRIRMTQKNEDIVGKRRTRF